MNWAQRTKIFGVILSKNRLVTNTFLCAEWPDGAWCSGHTKVAPGGLPSTPHTPSHPWTGALAGQRDRFSVACLLWRPLPPQTSLPSTPSLLQRTVPKCQHVPPGPSQACPFCRGAGVTRSVESTHPWREHNGPRTGWLTGLGTDNTVNRAEWQTASQNNEKPAERWLENISHHYQTHTHTDIQFMNIRIYTRMDVYKTMYTHACTLILTWKISLKLVATSELLSAQGVPAW